VFDVPCIDQCGKSTKVIRMWVSEHTDIDVFLSLLSEKWHQDSLSYIECAISFAACIDEHGLAVWKLNPTRVSLTNIKKVECERTGRVWKEQIHAIWQEHES
jgi:hypothetical protein